MQLRRILIGIALLPLLATCGGSGPFTVNGNIRGSGMSSGDAISSVGAIRLDSTPLNAAVVVLSNSSVLCSAAGASKQPKNSKFLLFVINDRTTSTGTPGPGTYTIWSGSGTPPTKFSFAQYFQTDATCQETQLTVGLTGTVTITSVNNGDVSGNFDFTFDSNDHVTGSFSAKNCNALISALGNSTCG